MYIKRLLMIYIALMLFLFFPKQVSAVCVGHYKCALYDKLIGCDASWIEYTAGCPGTNKEDCEGGVGYAACAGECYVNETCFWTAPCSPDWTGCPTACGYDGGWDNSDGCGNYGWCDAATGPCCSPVNPDKPTLSTPANGTEIRVNVATTLNWNDVASFGTKCPTPNSNSYKVCIDSTGSSGCDYKNQNTGATSQFDWTPSAADQLVYWWGIANNGSTETWSDPRSLCVEGFNAASTSYVSTWTPACGSQTRTCTENCGTNDCAGVILTNCQHCDPTIPAWPTAWPNCNGAHKQSITRTCIENDGLCDGDDCDAYMANQTDPAVCPVGSTCTYDPATNTQTRTRDCVGTITGTLFDASDYSSCPANFTGVPTINSQQFNITSPYDNPPNTTWPPSDTAKIKTLTTSSAGVYSTNAFIPGTYLYDFSALSAEYTGVGDPKLKCQGASASFNANECPDVDLPCITKTYDFGFWRIYGGWWQAVGGSVYAGSGVKSNIPASLPLVNQRLILGNPPSVPDSRFGVMVHGFDWTVNNEELGTNPDRAVSEKLWRIKSVYEGLRYDYDYYLTRMSIFDSTIWYGSTPITYDDGGKGYQILKRTGNATISSLSLTGIQKLIILVDGNVTVAGNVDVPDGAFLAVIAKGSITFNANVTDAQGWFVAETINVPCSDDVLPAGCDKDDTQFEGQGSFVGWSGISLGRDMYTENNNKPSEKFVYRPDFVLNAPAPMKLYTKKFAPFIPDF